MKRPPSSGFASMRLRRRFPLERCDHLARDLHGLRADDSRRPYSTGSLVPTQNVVYPQIADRVPPNDQRGIRLTGKTRDTVRVAARHVRRRARTTPPYVVPNVERFPPVLNHARLPAHSSGFAPVRRLWVSIQRPRVCSTTSSGSVGGAALRASIPPRPLWV